MIILERALQGVSAASLVRFARRAQQLAGCRGEVNVLISGNDRLQDLNRVFRGKNQPTDVLSFPRGNEPGGDIAISTDLARANARMYGHSPADELRILILHGMLHLAGYDHETDNGRMAKLEARLRSQLKLPGSLTERACSNGRSGFRSRNKHSSAGNSPARRRSR